MEFTLEEFYAPKLGPTLFVDRLAGALGIHASEIKIVSVYEGSLIVNYEMEVPNDDPEALKRLKEKQDEVFAKGQFSFGGAKILEYESSVVLEAVEDNGTYKPVTIVAPANSEYKSEASVFVPNINVVDEVSTIYYNETVYEQVQRDPTVIENT